MSAPGASKLCSNVSDCPGWRSGRRGGYRAANSSGWRWPARSLAIRSATAELRKVVPEPASYLSESDFFEPNWQRAFWGDHYARLLAVKERFDPAGLFFVHHGVGSERWSADGFTRVG